MLSPRARRGLVLAAILLVALGVRLATIRFGLPALNDPDELMFEMGALRMLRGLTLNPGWFGHPATTTMYVLAIVNVLMVGFAIAAGYATSLKGVVGLIYADPSWMILPGRIAMVAFAIWSVWLTWRLTTRFFGWQAGAIAALLLALNPVAVNWSQIIRSDVMACTFMLLCLHAAADIAERGRTRDHARAAWWLGLAIATKWPFALTVLAIGGAALVAARSGRTTPRRAAIAVVATGIAAIAVLILVSPYLLLDHQTVLKNVRGEGQLHHLGATGGGFWANLWWYLSGPLYRGFGPGGVVLLLLGAIRLPRHRIAFATLAPVAIAFVLLFSRQTLVWERWALPLMPIGAIIAGLGFMVLRDALAHVLPDTRARRAVQAVVLAIVLGLCFVPLAVAAWSDGRARMTDTRQLASAWARRHVPHGRTILVEHFAFDIVGEPWRFLFPMGDAGCVDAGALLHGKIDYATIERARGTRSNVDYGTIAPDRADTCRADVAILTQYDRYRLEQALFPREAATYRRLLAQGKVRATFAPRPGHVAGPVVTIVSFPR
jgi:hypothetical protein